MDSRKKNLLREREKLERFEMIALDAIIHDEYEGTDLRLIIQKIFEAAQMITKIDEILKNLKK
tara:strand:- start:428 stop:616 length:189 start_codon:yes stop_codon:yes gene_type:complete